MKVTLAALAILALATPATAQVTSRPVPTGIDVPGPTCHGYNAVAQRYIAFDCDGLRRVGGIRNPRNLNDSLNNRPIDSRIFFQGGSASDGSESASDADNGGGGGGGGGGGDAAGG